MNYNAWRAKYLRCSGPRAVQIPETYLPMPQFYMQQHHYKHPTISSDFGGRGMFILRRVPLCLCERTQLQNNPKKSVLDVASLHADIADMMHGLGDHVRPNPDSVKLMERILRQELRGIFNEASLVAMRRTNNPMPTQSDFEFLMRKRPSRISRLRGHLRRMRALKELLTEQENRWGLFTDLEPAHGDDELNDHESFDDACTRRQIRQKRITEMLTSEQLVDYKKTSKCTFYCRRAEKAKHKFRCFLDLPADLYIPPATLAILSSLAYETLSVVVDYAILTRLDASNRIVEPHGSQILALGVLQAWPEVTQSRGMEVVRPISVREINEGMRRFRQMTDKKIGYYRSSCDRDFQRTFLAL